MTTISVIVPIYKTRPYLEKCVDSLLDQTFSNFELILVDDGSPDDSGMLCDELARQDERIRVIHKENGGLTSARKAGYTAAKGEYIAFVDSDDYVHPDYLNKLYSAAAENNAEISICSYTLVTANGEQTMRLPWSDKLIEESEINEKYAFPLVGRIRDGSHINLPGFLWLRLYLKNSLSHEYFISEREVFTEDDVFNMLHSEKIKRLAVVDEPLYYYVQHSESLSNRYCPDKWNMLQNRYAFCKEWLASRGLIEAGQKRLAAAAISVVYASVDNAINQGKYMELRNELKQITQSDLFKELCENANPRHFEIGQRVVFYLVKYRLWYILFCYRKRRVYR